MGIQSGVRLTWVTVMTRSIVMSLVIGRKLHVNRQQRAAVVQGVGSCHATWAHVQRETFVITNKRLAQAKCLMRLASVTLTHSAMKANVQRSLQLEHAVGKVCVRLQSN